VVGRPGTLTDNTLAKTRFFGIMLVDTERGHNSSQGFKPQFCKAGMDESTEESEDRRDGETRDLARLRVGSRIKVDVERTGTVG